MALDFFFRQRAPKRSAAATSNCERSRPFLPLLRILLHLNNVCLVFHRLLVSDSDDGEGFLSDLSTLDTFVLANSDLFLHQGGRDAPLPTEPLVGCLLQPRNGLGILLVQAIATPDDG